MLLEHKPAMGPAEHGKRVVTHGRQVFAVESDGAGGRTLKSGERVEQR